MRKLAIVLALAVLVAAACDDDDDAAEPDGRTTATESPDEGADVTLPPGGTRLAAQLTGAEEAPDPGDPDGSGSAIVTLNAETRQVCFDVTVTGLDQPSGMHIHEAAPGEAGPITIPLVEPASGDEQIIDCVDEVDVALIEAVSSSPGDYYLNVHTEPFPGGAIRGQLSAG